MQLLGATASHVGNVRDSNQDRVHFGGYTGVVADGMGGHQGGEMAASIAISEFVDVVDPIPPGGLVELVEEANRAVFERAADPDLRGMGTTLVALTLRPTEEKVSVVNVGDSRAYFLRGEEFGQLTLDHSLVEDLVRQNRLTRDEALTHPQRNILTRALGIASQVEVDRFLVPTRIGDRFLLCSDGLFNEVTEEDIVDILRNCQEPNDAADRLVEAAIAAAGRDNVTVAVIDVVEDGQGGDVSSMAAETLLVPAASSAAGNGDGLEPTGGERLGAGGGATGVDLVEAPVEVDAEQVYDDALLAANGAGAESTAEHALQLKLDEPADANDGPTGATTGDIPVAKRKKRRWFRALIGLGVLAALAAGAYFGVNYWADSKWYVATVSEGDDTLAIFRGRPEGFLWTEPSQVSLTDDHLEQLTSESRNDVLARQLFDSEADALAFVEGLEHEAALTSEDLSATVDAAAADTVEDVANNIDQGGAGGDDSSSTATTGADDADSGTGTVGGQSGQDAGN